MPKFKIVKVHSFRIGDKRYAKGEIVDLSEEDAERFKGANFLEPMEKPRSKPEKRIVKAESPKFPFFFLMTSRLVNTFKRKEKLLRFI